MPVPVPDKATLKAVRKRGEEERAFWQAHRDELTRRYPDEFVAVRRGEVIDHDPDLMALALRLQEHGVQTSDVSIERMTTEPEVYLL